MSERFAVLDHDWPIPHRDLFLERDGALLAWRLPPGGKFPLPLPAIPNASHRIDYLDFEGPVAGDRGTVRRVEGGPLEWIHVSAEVLTFRLFGTQLRGRFELRRLAEHDWRFLRAPTEAEA